VSQQHNDQELFVIIKREADRIENEINLIASENYPSKEVMAVTGSVLTTKYAEGYPGKRYYGGCQFVDQAEQLAIERCKKLFGAEHANVQPHSGSQANMGVYFAVLEPGDTILGMSLAEGGHLTHGHKVNFSGKLFNAVQYKVDPKTERLDYDEMARLAQEHKPKILIVGASAYSRFIDFERCAQIAKSVNAYLLVDMAHIAGLVAAGVHPSPVPHADFVTSTTHKTLRGPRGGLILCKEKYAQAVDKSIMPGMQGGPLMHVIAAKAVAFKEALSPEFVVYQKQVITNAQAMAQAFQDLNYRVVSGGTDNHLFVLDIRFKNITGRDAERALERAGIAISRSCIPFDPAKPWVTSGIRIGTPAITTRGMQVRQSQQIVQLIDRVLSDSENDDTLSSVKQEAAVLCNQFPVYK